MTVPLLRLVGIGRSYNSNTAAEVRALEGIDLDIYKGEFVAIVGPSGGGKTTLLSVVGLLDQPTSGEYWIDEDRVDQLSDAARTRLRALLFSFVFQSFHLLERRPVVDSAELALLYQGVPRAERRQRSIEALRQLGLAGVEDSVAANLSGGQRQRVAIARAIAADTPIVLADEPTGNLDTASGARVLAELTRLNEAGATVIVVTHSEAVADVASRVVRIVDGRVAADSTPHRFPAARADSVPHAAHSSRLRPVDILRDAFRSVTSRARQTIGLIAAVSLAVAMLIVTVGIANSAQFQVSQTFDARANREVTVSWASGPSAPPLAEALQATSKLSGVASVAGISDHGPVEVRRGDVTAAVTLHGFVGELSAATEASIRWLGGGERTLSADQVILGGALASQLALPPLAIGPTVRVGEQDYVVVGVLDSSARYPLLAGSVMMGEESARAVGELAQGRLAIVTVAGAAPQVGAQAAPAIDPYNSDQFRVEVPVDPGGLRQEVEAGVGVSLAAFTALATLIATLTLANAIGMSVIARSGELGLRRAVGARGSQLAALVSTEALIIGAAGGLAGLVVGILSILGFTISQRWLPVFDATLAPVAVIVGIGMAALASLLGARRAARIAPAAALRE